MKRIYEDKTIINSVKNRFYAKVLLPNENGCMEWIGSLSYGYGNILGREKKKIILAHRLSYEIHYGKFDESLCVCHTCDNPRCVAPEHLFLGTKKDNSDDMFAKNRNHHLAGEENKNAKLTIKQVNEIRNKLMDGSAASILAKEYGVSDIHIRRIKHKQSWKE